MKHFIVCLFFILPLFPLVGCDSPTSTSRWEIENIIAHYPLKVDPDDVLGKQAPMELRNTPFKDGGIYCNGIYWWSDDTVNRSHASTPRLDSLNMQSFTISAYFKVTEITANLSGRPVFIGGGSARWMGAIIRSDTTMSLLYNNHSSVHTTTRYRLNQWHMVSISYDSTAQRGDLYLDGQLIASATFALNHGNDKKIMTTNFSNGTTFLGILRDLKIFNAATIPPSTGH